MSNFTIRRAEPRDTSGLFVLLQAKAAFDGALASLTASEEDLGRSLFCEDPKFGVFVAERDRQLAGFASFYPVFSTYAAKPGLWMDDLFVRDDIRGQGVGLELLRSIAAEAHRTGCCKIEWSLQKSNLRGIAFYEREGAVVREVNRFAKLDERGIARLLQN